MTVDVWCLRERARINIYIYLWPKACIATTTAVTAFLHAVAHQELRASEQKLEGPSPEIEVLQL